MPPFFVKIDLEILSSLLVNGVFLVLKVRVLAVAVAAVLTLRVLAVTVAAVLTLRILAVVFVIIFVVVLRHSIFSFR